MEEKRLDPDLLRLPELTNLYHTWTSSTSRKKQFLATMKFARPEVRFVTQISNEVLAFNTSRAPFSITYAQRIPGYYIEKEIEINTTQST